MDSDSVNEALAAIDKGAERATEPERQALAEVSTPLANIFDEAAMIKRRRGLPGRRGFSPEPIRRPSSHL